MPASDRVIKDKEMASRMKREGVERRSGQCCLCYQQIPLARIQIHLTAQCKGPARRKGSNGPASKEYPRAHEARSRDAA